VSEKSGRDEIEGCWKEEKGKRDEREIESESGNVKDGRNPTKRILCEEIGNKYE
jgi:hypothetical protein